MAGELLPSDIDDIFVNTLENPDERNKYPDISFTKQNNIVRKFMDEQGRLPEKSGIDSCNFRAMVSTQGNARWTGMYAPNRRGRRNMFVKAKMPWSKCDSSGEYDIDEPVFQQGDNIEIINEVRALKHSIWRDLYALKEEGIFGMPQSSDERPLPYFGLPYWFPVDTSSTGDFVGMNPSGFSDVAGINRTTTPGWRPYTFGFPTVDWTVVRQVQNAMVLTNFENPDPNFKDDAQGMGKRSWFMISTLNFINEFSDVLLSRNQDFGDEVMNFGRVMVNSRAIEFSAWLNENSTADDLYAINTQYTHLVGKKGATMRQSKPEVIPGASDMRMLRVADWSALYCENCREGGWHAARS